jgi:hypothetical protein
MPEANHASSDAHDAAKLAILCVDTVLVASPTTRYKVESISDPLDHDQVVAYVENLEKPVSIRAEYDQGRQILLRASSKVPWTGAASTSVAEALRHPPLQLSEDSLILVTRGNEPQFSVRLSAVRLWEESYYLRLVNYSCSFREADSAAKAAHAAAVMQVSRDKGPQVGTIFLR